MKYVLLPFLTAVLYSSSLFIGGVAGDYQFVDNQEQGGLNARQSYEMNRGRKDYKGFQRQLDIIKEMHALAEDTNPEAVYDADNAVGRKHKELYKVNASERARLLRDQLLPDGYHVFDRAHQYTEGSFLSASTPEGWSFAISTPNRNQIDQASINYYANGRRDGISLKFFRNEENNKDEIQLLEYHKDHQYRPTLLLREDNEHLYEFFKLPCEKKRAFLLRCVELLDNNYVRHPAEIGGESVLLKTVDSVAAQALEEQNEAKITK